MIKILIFDADGVLINSERFSKRLAREYGISTDKTTPFFTGIFNECLIGNVDLKESISPYLKDWGWEKGVDDFLDELARNSQEPFLRCRNKNSQEPFLRCRNKNHNFRNRKRI